VRKAPQTQLENNPLAPGVLWRLQLEASQCGLGEKMEDFAEYQKHRSVK